MMPLQSPLEFALSERCFACGAEPGEQCRSNGYDDKKHGTLTFPHFGRVGMPSSRGWSLRVPLTRGNPIATRGQS
jgi:hypothetical protein